MSSSYRATSFDPRAGTAQLCFGAIYLTIALGCSISALSAGGAAPMFTWFMAALFGIMAAKSLFLALRSRAQLSSAQPAVATVTSCEADRGITVVQGTVEMDNGDPLPIESRYAGAAVARDIEDYLAGRHDRHLPALVVGRDTRRPRGMFNLKVARGRMVEPRPAAKQQEPSA
ncbi:MAG: hypothetical protein K6A65_02050 [Succinivibrionaceae bacterium]|nr:hypothetical protein [Succinivibrionaceae bacterium]